MTTFPTDPSGLPEASAPAQVRLADGASYELEVAPVAKRLGEDTVRMLAYNGSVPGPLLSVGQGTEITVVATNQGDLDTTVHWHGLRLENRYDGVPHDTQPPIPVGGTFTYRLRFPDPGLYWYHPHIREDYGQELGLYGCIVVTPSDPDYWPPADRELVLTLDDVLLEDGRIAPFGRTESSYTAMGRFGNVMLIGGELSRTSEVSAGEVVRLLLVNTANTRVFNVHLDGALLKLVGGDSGRVEHEEIVESVLLAPSERAVVDVLFSQSGTFVLEHRTPDRVYPLVSFTVTGTAEPAVVERFRMLRTDPELSAERKGLESVRTAPPDRTLAFVAEMDMGEADAGAGYLCPMHPEVTSPDPGRCPKCGMKLLPATTADAAPHDHEHHDHSAGDGIEWEDDMVEVNRETTPANTRWKLVDRDTGAANAEIDWAFGVGDRVKIRLVNELDSDHPMHHPFHIHGAGRFLVLTRNDEVEPQLVWKDTVLVRTGETVDILLAVTNPGRWMAHCHIAEHAEAGMMFSFDVRERA